MMRFLVVVLSLCVATSAAAATQELLPEDFAAGQRVLVAGKAPFYRLRLPEPVYTGVANEDLRDIRMFNGRGEPVPFALVTAPSQQPTAQISVDLRAFSLPGAGAEASADAAGVITYDQGRMQLSWSRTPSQQRPQLLLVAPDAEGSIGSTLSALQLSWTTPAASWQQTATLETSDDMADWTVVAAKQPLMDLRENGQRLKIDRIAFPATRARYWRLTLSDGPVPPLTRVEGLHQAQAVDPDLVWLQPKQAQSIARYERLYRFPAVISVERVRIGLPQPNSVVPLTLEARDGADSAWQPLLRTVAWRLNPAAEGGEEQISPPVPVPLARARELRLSAGPGGWGGGEPRLELGRSALYLIFNARGNGPFLLAWGSAAAQHEALDAQRLIPGYEASFFFGLPEAEVAGGVELGGEARRFEAGLAERQARWRGRLLWIVLIAGVGALSLLAWKLWRDMQPERDGHDA